MRAGPLDRVAVAAFALLVGCGEGPLAGSDGRVLFEVAGAFSFRGPSDLRALPGAPGDSLSGRWRNPRLEVFYDHGWYSDPLAGDAWRGARRSAVDVDGRPGELVRLERAIYDDGLDHVAALHVPDVGDGRTKLTLIVRAAGAEDADEAEAILRSVRLAGPGRPG